MTSMSQLLVLRLWVANLHGSSLPVPSQISRLAGLLLRASEACQRKGNKKSSPYLAPSSVNVYHTAVASDGKRDLQSKSKQSALLFADIELSTVRVGLYTAGPNARAIGVQDWSLDCVETQFKIVWKLLQILQFLHLTIESYRIRASWARHALASAAACSMSCHHEGRLHRTPQVIGSSPTNSMIHGPSWTQSTQYGLYRRCCFLIGFRFCWFCCSAFRARNHKAVKESTQAGTNRTCKRKETGRERR